ncbi:bestrophin-like domain [Streptomyces sp. NPDC001985]|uniref:bestrophin-like domain n=1 Tax=Streptomyces sp. NPDC001985 TaxID=3154406 RepID=UPI003317469F
MLITVVVAALALVGGVAANRLLHRRAVGDDTEGLSVSDLTGPMQTMTVLVLAFVLAMAAGSHGNAEEAALAEAGAVDHMYEVADFVPAARRERLQAAVVCYTRAVRAVEWPAPAGGRASPEVTVWSTDFRVALRELGGAPPFEMLVVADDRRAQARQTRLAESSPTIPGGIYWFMLVSLAVTIVALGLCLPRTGNRPQLVALLVITALLTGALLMIRDVERPFTGLIRVPPTAIADTGEQATRAFRAAYGTDGLPCDDRGGRRT